MPERAKREAEERPKDFEKGMNKLTRITSRVKLALKNSTEVIQLAGTNTFLTLPVEINIELPGTDFM